jgi:hypothetical protein
MVVMMVRQVRDERQPLPAHLANKVAITPCRPLPFLPPITRNVKLPDRANPLELGMRADPAHGSILKNGKNGNVHRASQHCRP